MPHRTSQLNRPFKNTKCMPHRTSQLNHSNSRKLKYLVPQPSQQEPKICVCGFCLIVNTSEIHGRPTVFHKKVSQ